MPATAAIMKNADRRATLEMTGRPMTPKLRRFLESANGEEIRDMIETGVLLADPVAQTLLKRLAAPARKRRAGPK